MNHGPVNSLSKPFVDELTNKIKELETDPEVRRAHFTRRSACTQRRRWSAGCANLLSATARSLCKRPGPQVNGVVLTSGCKKVFSAGLDLQEIIKPESEKVRAFWHSMQELWLTLYGSPLTTVAAVNGAHKLDVSALPVLWRRVCRASCSFPPAVFESALWGTSEVIERARFSCLCCVQVLLQQLGAYLQCLATTESWPQTSSSDSTRCALVW